jgi:hypothetical protein
MLFVTIQIKCFWMIMIQGMVKTVRSSIKEILAPFNYQTLEGSTRGVDPLCANFLFCGLLNFSQITSYGW